SLTVGGAQGAAVNAEDLSRVTPAASSHDGVGRMWVEDLLEVMRSAVILGRLRGRATPRHKRAHSCVTACAPDSGPNNSHAPSRTMRVEAGVAKARPAAGIER